MQTFWGPSNRIDSNPNRLIYAILDIKGSVMWPMSDTGAIATPKKTLPNFIGDIRMTTNPNTVIDDALTYLRTGSDDKRITIVSGNVRNNGENTTKLGTIRMEFKSLERLETTDTGWIFKPRGQSAVNDRLYQNFNLWDDYGAGINYNSARFTPGFGYKVTVNYYSSADIVVDCQVYGGFTFRKISENNKQLNLSGAQYVVKKGEKYLSAVGAQDTAAAFTDDIAQAMVFETNETGTFTVAPIPDGTYEVS